MKKILLIIILLTPLFYSQNKILYTNAGKALIADSMRVERLARITADNLRLLKTDTLSLSNRINLKFNTADTSVFISDALLNARGYQTASQVASTIATYGFQTATQVQTYTDNHLFGGTLETSPSWDNGDVPMYNGTSFGATPVYNRAETDNRVDNASASIEESINDLQQSQLNQDYLISALFDSVASLRASIEFLTPTFPDAPSNLLAVGRSTDILVNWMDYQMSASPDSFELAISNTNPALGGDPIVTSIFTTDTFYVHSGIPTNTVYWYYVKAWLDNEFSTISNIDSAFMEESQPITGSTYAIIENYTSHTNGTGVPTSILIDRPVGIENNDLMLAIVGAENDTSGATPQFSMQADWTYLGESGDATQGVRIAAFYKISDGTEDLTDTITMSMTNSNSVAFWLRISNADTSDLINTSNFTLSGGNSGTHIIPALTTDADSCLVIAGLAFDGADYGATFINGFDWRNKQDTVSAYYGSGIGIAGIWGSKQVNSAGTTGVDTISIGTSDGAAYFMVAINKSGSIGEPTPAPEGEYTDTLYVSASATGTGTGQTVGSPYTIYQALNSANAGNLILAAAGTYNLNAQDLDITRAGTYASRIELRGVIDPADSGGFSYSTNSTTFIVTTDQNNDSAPMFEVFAPYNTIKDVLMINAATGQAGWGRIDADAYCTILDGIEFKQTHLTTGSIHSWRIYADSVIIRNSFFNRGSRCIIWFETNGDDNNTIRTALVENNVFTGAFDHGAIQFMPNTATVDPNWLEDVTVRNNTFIDNPYAWNLHFRYFRRANVYNNLFINSGQIYVNDRHYPNDTDSLNSEGSLFVYNTAIGCDAGDIVGINRQMNGIIFANNLQVFDATPSYIWRFTNLAVGEEPYNRGHYFDYNFFDITGSTSISSVISTWVTGYDTYVTLNWAGWNALGFDNHTIIDTAPTFTNSAINDYTPLDESSPQVGIGIPITTANGFRLNITTDKNGNPRDATNPTIGAFEWTE